MSLLTRTQTIDQAQHLFDEIDAIEREYERQRRTQPQATLFDGDWKNGAAVTEAISLRFRFVKNDTGDATLILPVWHHMAVWALQYGKRNKKNIHMVVEKDGIRWSGRMKNVTFSQDDDGNKVVVLEFLDDIQELKHFNVWPNPLAPAWIQTPKTFFAAGPSKWILKLGLFLNVLRKEASFYHLPDDPLDLASWVQGATMWNWSKLVAPGSFLLDDSQWCLVNSRFKTWHEMAKHVLEDAGLMITYRRWLDGDEAPWPGAIMRNGQLVFDIVDKSGVFEGTALGGTVAGGLVRTVTSHADNFVDEIVTSVANPEIPAEYMVSRLFGTHPKMPHVVYVDGDVSGVETLEYTHSPATIVQVNGGGKSMPGVNEGLEALVKLTGDLFSVITLGIVGWGGIANTLLEPLYKDVLFAFYSLKSVVRSMQLGWDHYFESFAENGKTGYTLSAVMAIREVMWDTRSRESVTAKVRDGAPYLIGERGRGHFGMGDRIGIAPQILQGRVVVEQVSELEYEADRDQAGWVISLGDREEKESPIEKSLRQLRDVFGTLHDLGVM